MTQISNFEQLLSGIREIIARDADRDTRLRAVCEALAQAVPHYNWVGFYLVDPAQARELVLGPFVGAPTEHTQIAFGQGICGQAAATEMTFVIQDVSQETNYLSCSPSVKSEIVVPIFKEGVVVGELDIDSHRLAPFGAEDRAFLEAVCAKLAQLF
ncbi:MAG: GAF domain-containing protein [Anaerolineae bacterium]|nr:GAF domain-containing protein [Anaerolineae bacterium]